MAKRRSRKPVEWLIAQIDGKLKQFGALHDGLSLRDKVVRLASICDTIKDLGVSAVADSGLDARGGMERMRLYLVEYVGTVVDGCELAVVSGISDYPRRIRQLRVESGYQIASGNTPDPEAGLILRPDQYLLVRKEPDQDASRRWHVVNRIRRSNVGVHQRLLDFLTENVNKPVTTEELAYVARNAREFARRVRELRTEQGFAIATRFTGRPDLSVGQYVLESLDRVAAPHDRHISDSVQQAIYRRDENRCRLCGWNHAKWSPEDPRLLELHHLEHHEDGGANDETNLVALCSKCHDGVHAGQHDEALSKLKKAIWQMYST